MEQLNLYAQEVMSDERYEKWDQISIEDLEAYFGFNILMGINSLPSLEDYWKKDPVYHYAPVADCISRDRFSEISILWTILLLYHVPHQHMTALARSARYSTTSSVDFQQCTHLAKI